MNQAPGDFTRFLRQLAAAGDTPSVDAFDRVWSALRGALASELRKRGLWHLSPRLLGIVGADRWLESAESADGNDALEELTADCYEYVFLRRAQSLVAQLEVKETIEGLVFRSIRNFLFERQKANDPIGYRTFDVLRTAVETAHRRGLLTLDEPGPRIHNGSVLHPSIPPSEGPRADADAEALTASWLDDLLPDLLLAQGTSKADLADRLTPRLGEIRREITFGELVDPLKRGARRCWHALLQAELGARARDVDAEAGAPEIPVVPPSLVVEDAESYEVLASCVDGRLAELATDRRTHRYLVALWTWLRAWATEDSEDDPWSHRRLAAELGIPRARLPELFGFLEEVVAACRGATRASPRVRSPTEDDGR